MLLTLPTVLFALAQLGQVAGAAALPADARLDPVRAHIEEVVSRSAQEGLPSEVIVSKVREGLAKGVDPARISAAADRLARGLTDARRFVVTHRGPGDAAPELVRALAEATLAGVDLEAARPLVDGKRGANARSSARAVEVLTDLSRRGYPARASSEVVADLLAREPEAMGRLPSALETVRQEQALSAADSVNQIAQGLRTGGSLQAASRRAAAAGGGGVGPGGSKGAGKGNPGGGSGGGGTFVPPGQLKKQAESRMKNTPPGQSNNPGKGMGPKK